MVFFNRFYTTKNCKFLRNLLGLCSCILLFFIFKKVYIFSTLFFHNSSLFSSQKWSLTGHVYDHLNRVEFIPIQISKISIKNPNLCTGLYKHKGYNTRCQYLLANPQCNSAGFFNYMVFFYCDCENYRFLGYLVLAIWLVSLFFILGNTATDYFCCLLEKLSNLLRFSPTVAGVILLPLGNGAPDVFASIAAFVGSDSGDVGMNSVLGAAIFIACVVVGTVSLSVPELGLQIDAKCFVRDVFFLIFTLISLLVILIVGEVTVFGSIAFVMIYLGYAMCVAANEIWRKRALRLESDFNTPLLPVTEIKSPHGDEKHGVPLLEEASNVEIYSIESAKACLEDTPELLWGWNVETTGDQSCFSCSKLCLLLKMPLTLPGRLTIPIVDEERWSKGYAVASASLAPMLLALLWNTIDNGGSISKGIAYLVGAIVGSILGIMVFVYTRVDGPPQKFLFPWVFGGFFMSIIWFYIIANELVALVLALGVILGIKPSVLGLTVMAWGNSTGDFVSNVAMAMNGGDGVQISMSGCYAGPMFNILAGLGISLLYRAWSNRPAPYIVPRDTSLYYTMGFLVLALVWSLVVLPRNHMRPGKLLGIGLITIYLVFILIRLTMFMVDLY